MTRLNNLLEAGDFTAKWVEECDLSALGKYNNGMPAGTTVTTKECNTYLLEKIVEYKCAPHRVDMTLLQDFQEDFEDWDVDRWAPLDLKLRREMRDLLRARGIYTGYIRGRMAEQFVKLQVAEDLPDWDDKSLRTMDFPTNTRAYRKQQELLGSQRPLVRPGTRPGTPALLDEKDTGQGPPGRPPTGKAPAPASLAASVATGANTTPLGPRHQSENTGDFQEKLAYLSLDHVYDFDGPQYSTLPPENKQIQSLDPTSAAQFTKLWNNADSYTGDAYDVLDDKVLLFLGVCSTARIKISQAHAVWRYAVTKNARDYYIHDIGTAKNLRQIYDLTKAHFDTEVNRHQYFTDWTTITFRGAMANAKEGERNPITVLNNMLDKLRLCQRALGPDYTGKGQLVTTIHRAVRGVPEFEMALMMVPQTYEEMASKLRSSLETARYREPTRSAFYTADDNDTNFVDRRYLRNGGFGQRMRGNPRDQGG